MATQSDVRRIALSFPAVLVRLKAVSVADLEVLITEAWRCQAPKALAGKLQRGN